MATVLETERLVVREWTPDDAEVLFEMCRDPVVMRYVFDGRAWDDIERARRWLGRVAASYGERGYGPWAVVEKAGGGVAGSCGFSYLTSTGEVDFGYVFARRYWGKGIATEAARAILLHGLSRFGFAEVNANTVPEHHASRRVLEKIGFEFRGMRRYDGDDEDSAFYVTAGPHARPGVEPAGGEAPQARG